MRNTKIIREERAAKIEAMKALHAKAGTEKRSLSTEESTQWEALNVEVDNLSTETRMFEKQEKLEAEQAASKGVEMGSKGPSEKEKRDLSKFSVLKTLRALVENKPLDGIEAEMHQESQIEARAMGETIRGFGIPSMVLEHRDNSITMPTQPEDGSAVMIQKKQYGSMLEMLRNAMACQKLGCTYLNDLDGNLAFTAMTERPVASWKPEVGDLDKSNVKFSSEELAAKRLGTFIVQSKLFLHQTAPSIEDQIRKEILYAIAEGVDVAAIAGTGANNQPIGILNKTGVNTVELGTNGGVLTRESLVAIETALADLNLTGDNYKWLINTATRGNLKKQLLDAGSGRFLMESNNSLLEYPVVTSNVMSRAGTKGTGTNLSSMVFGDWEELVIAQWGGIDLTVDPYTLLVGGQVKIVAQGFFNIYIRRANAFVKVTDIVTA